MFNIWGFYYDLIIMAVVILNVTLTMYNGEKNEEITHLLCYNALYSS